jgi:hypothetical protein
MTQLIAELRRFSARRIVRVTVLITLALVLISIMGRTVHGHAPTPPNYISDNRLHLHDSLPGNLDGTGVALLFVAFVLGASFVGAEFNVGSLTTQLMYEPRRWRVHLAKGTTVFIGVGAFALLTFASLAITMLVGASLHGVTDGATSAWWVTRITQSLRLTASVALAGAMAYTVALMARRTSAAAIIFFVQYPLLYVDSHKGVLGFISHYAPLRGLLVMAANPSPDSLSRVFEPIHTVAGGVALALAWMLGLTLLAGAVFDRSEVR